MVVAVYPGTFDPLTRGHEDIVRRVAPLFGRVVVAVAESPAKQPLFEHSVRLDLARTVLGGYAQVQVVGFAGLLRDLVRAHQAQVIVRGVRSLTDFDYEAQLAGMNRHLMPDVQTLLLPAAEPYQSISGTLVRQIAQLGGDISLFVAPEVQACWQKQNVSPRPHSAGDMRPA